MKDIIIYLLIFIGIVIGMTGLFMAWKQMMQYQFNQRYVIMKELCTAPLVFENTTYSMVCYSEDNNHLRKYYQERQDLVSEKYFLVEVPKFQ